MLILIVVLEICGILRGIVLLDPAVIVKMFLFNHIQDKLIQYLESFNGVELGYC